MSLKNTSRKIISFLIIISILAPTIVLSRPKQTDAFLGIGDIVIDPITNIQTTLTVGSLVKSALKEVAKQALMAVARNFLKKMTTSTVNWINSGFHGAPLFVENPKSFFKDIAKFKVKTFVDMIGYDGLRMPFGKDIAINAINSYKRQFADNAQNSLSKVINDPVFLSGFRNDFNIGGWNGFLINTQYPQNNYVGFQMLANEELARQLAGTNISTADKVKDTLQQGMGFLSPETCPSNPLYNNAKNEFQRPTFKSTLDYDWDPPEQKSGESNEEYDKKTAAHKTAYDANFEFLKQSEKNSWNATNACPGGLKATTPGAVVANQITNAMGSQFRQSELAAAMGNSIAAITDALLNKFMKDGLNALETKINPDANNGDEWDYFGNRLGTVTAYDQPWNTTPDQVIVLKDFKKAVQDAIDNTTAEIQLMDNNSSNPGLKQVFSQVWPKVQKLDQCLPGPDLGWPDRLDTEMNRVLGAIDNLNPEQVQINQSEFSEVSEELKMAVDYLKDWINDKMSTTLPSSPFYIDAVNDLKTIYQEANEVNDKKKLKNNALIRLQSIKNNLEAFSKDPEPKSAGEKTLIDLRKKYDVISLDTSNEVTMGETRNQLDAAKDKSANLDTLITKCEADRKIRGWSIPGGSDSKWQDKSTDTERSLFCDSPLVGGYSHKSFINQGAVTHSTIPLVNAKNVLMLRIEGIALTRSLGFDINLSCNNIYNASTLTYKGNLGNAELTTHELTTQMPATLDAIGSTPIGATGATQICSPTPFGDIECR